ncbi:YhcN/YlaJ family sporulation lipoprotein [Bacillus andreraoultii]|uniref:YhcN/YlaJ family sporulation lipoprotein n=1 Tax=Bacillus andreraoultii TaxID=1499685 RepID=UPI00067F2B20|nr:YhcN/YlaJ family sporulation lipoprotein [Bacillus andreraoultii]
MKKRLIAYFSISVSSLLLFGCTYYNKSQSGDHRNMVVTENTNNSVSQNRQQNNQRILQVRDKKDNGDHYAQNFFVDTNAEKKIIDLKEVVDADVIITNNQAFVSVVLANQQYLSSNLKENIRNQIRSIHTDIDHIYISSNPHFVQELNEFSIRIHRGDKNIANDFHNMINDYFFK